ncbi:putative diterpene cyclase [Actinacidiphila reveromycinica]|uniref:Putative diterpene cyclase n=1 Tax=Actinacidiphila reveromycinica TaxID=659352 RepID=A0A7U3UW44_9ACTN|nr:prenyltransferase/squalene oxidase repeat-containing protein [Streptomyces sp. SN-593]BBB01326.1 putative diterpene cyclase [Streptomyces sp. SN-593]
MTSLTIDPGRVSSAISSGARAVFAVQRPDGVFDYGAGALTSTLSTVGAVSALHFADPRGSADLIALGVDWLRRTQRPDGGWSMVPGGASEAGPTAVAAATLHLVAPDGAADAVGAGRAWMAGHGGLEAIPHPEVTAWCRQFYGYAGWIAPHDMRRFPLELALFPGLFRRLFDLRGPMVAALALAQTRYRRTGPVLRLLARAGEPRALSVIRQVYEHEGSTGGWCDDAWVTGLICAGLARADLAPDMVAGAVGWFRRMVNADGSWNSGTLDLTWSMYAAGGLMEAGYAEDGRLAPTRGLFLRDQQDRPFTAFGCPPGFWGWSGPRGWPASLETAEIVSALAGLPDPDGRARGAVARGVAWLTAQQDTRGSWGLCVRNTKVANSGPCPHMTAQCVDALLDSGAAADDPRVRRAADWLHTAQLPDGTYESVWYRMHTAGTSAVLRTLVRAGRGGHPGVARARGWLLATQLPDGSWSTGDGTASGTAPGTVEETAWAVGALLTAGLPAVDPAVGRGVRWLLDARLPDGSWPAARVNEYVRHVSRYPNGGLAGGLALRALARYRTAAEEGRLHHAH